jgi:hypothetical protein
MVVPNAGHGQLEMIQSLRAARQTGVRTRTQAANALKGWW